MKIEEIQELEKTETTNLVKELINYAPPVNFAEQIGSGHISNITELSEISSDTSHVNEMTMMNKGLIDFFYKLALLQQKLEFIEKTENLRFGR